MNAVLTSTNLTCEANLAVTAVEVRRVWNRFTTASVSTRHRRASILAAFTWGKHSAINLRLKIMWKFEPLTNSHAADDVIAFRIKDVVGVNVSGSFNDERLNATNQSLVCSHERGDTAVCTITAFKTTKAPSFTNPGWPDKQQQTTK